MSYFTSHAQTVCFLGWTEAVQEGDSNKPDGPQVVHLNFTLISFHSYIHLTHICN